MAARRIDSHGLAMPVILVLVLVLASGASAQSSSNCTTAADTLTPCLSYVTGTGSSPSPLCCAALDQVDGSNPECLCAVVTQLIASSAVNTTRVYGLPAACGLSIDTSNCSAVPPGSSPVGSPPPPPGVTTASPPPPPPSPKGNEAAALRPSAAVAALVGVAAFFFSWDRLSLWFC